MPEQNQRIEIVAGNDAAFRVVVRDKNGNLQNLAGATEITWVAARRAGDTPLISKTLLDGITVLDTGILGVELIPSDSIGLSGSYEHEAVVVIAGKRTTVTTGYLFVKPTLVPAA